MDAPTERSVPLGDEYLEAKARLLAQYRADKARQDPASHPALWAQYQADLAALDGQWETESTRLVAAYEAAKAPLWAQYCAQASHESDPTTLWVQYQTDLAVLRRHVLTQFAPCFLPAPPEDHEEAP